MDIYYFDKESIEMIRESLDLLPVEKPYRYEGGLLALLDLIQDRYNELTFEEAVIAKAAYLFKDIVKGHYFLGGNKRTGLLATRVFLNCNGLFIQTGYGDGYIIGLRIYYDMIDEIELREWIKNNIVNQNTPE